MIISSGIEDIIITKQTNTIFNEWHTFCKSVYIVKYIRFLIMQIPQFDENQLQVLKNIAFNILPYDQYINVIESLLLENKDTIAQKLSHSFLHKNHNIYLYGPVGRGKTKILEYIYNIYPYEKKKFHFDQLSAEIYHNLEIMDVKSFVKTYFCNTKLIWIDELQIYDITTAMIIKNLIKELCTTKHLIMMTGNVDPIDFYKDGINRDQFENFIPYFYEHFKCINLSGDKDYRLISRLNQKNSLSKHFWLASKKSTQEIKEKFQSISPAEQIIPYTIDVNMRIWKLENTLSQTVLIDFFDLAHDLHSAHDYMILIEKFPIVFLLNVPFFNNSNAEECRRFISFIDVLYDKQGVLYMESHSPIETIFQDGLSNIPFARTQSRLMELLGIIGAN